LDSMNFRRSGSRAIFWPTAREYVRRTYEMCWAYAASYGRPSRFFRNSYHTALFGRSSARPISSSEYPFCFSIEISSRSLLLKCFPSLLFSCAQCIKRSNSKDESPHFVFIHLLDCWKNNETFVYGVFGICWHFNPTNETRAWDTRKMSHLSHLHIVKPYFWGEWDTYFTNWTSHFSQKANRNRTLKIRLFVFALFGF
jgi:hypothetical protein